MTTSPPSTCSTAVLLPDDQHVRPHAPDAAGRVLPRWNARARRPVVAYLSHPCIAETMYADGGPDPGARGAVHGHRHPRPGGRVPAADGGGRRGVAVHDRAAARRCRPTAASPPRCWSCASSWRRGARVGTPLGGLPRRSARRPWTACASPAAPRFTLGRCDGSCWSTRSRPSTCPTTATPGRWTRGRCCCRPAYGRRGRLRGRSDGARLPGLQPPDWAELTTLGGDGAARPVRVDAVNELFTIA